MMERSSVLRGIGEDDLLEDLIYWFLMLVDVLLHLKWNCILGQHDTNRCLLNEITQRVIDT